MDRKLLLFWLSALFVIGTLWGRAEACASINGLPFTISASGCYNVTGSFSTSGSGISITVSPNPANVTINLQGHTLTGGTGSAISGSGESSVSVIGPGIITGWGGSAVTLGTNAIVQDVTAISNSGAGISVSDHSSVTGCVAQSNNGDGISCGSGCSISGNVADSNTGNGITPGTDGGVINNSMYNNGQDGLNNAAADIGFGENVMYCNNGSCTNPPADGCAATSTGSMSNNVCNGNNLF